MGKNRIIRILGGVIGGMVAHKILLKYTNKPESIHHLTSEVDNYRNNAESIASEFNWSEKDKKRIKEDALKSLNSELKEPHFHDVKFPIEVVNVLIEETMNEIL